MNSPALMILFGFVVCGDADSQGDQLLNLVRDAQRANWARKYESGEIVADVEWTVAIERKPGKRIGERRVSTHCTIKWKGPKTSWHWFETHHVTEKGQEPEHSEYEKRMISDGRIMTLYSPTSNLVSIFRSDSRYADGMWAVRLRPEECWYGGWGDQWFWRDYLGANPDRPMVHVAKYEAELRKDDHIAITCHHNDDSTGRVTVSVTHGGNVVEAEYAPKRGNGERSSHSWRELSQGEFVLAEHRCIRFKDRDFDRPWRSYHIKVNEFRPNIELDDNIFTESALQIAPNTKISNEVKGEKTRYKPIKRSSDEVTEERFGELSGTLGNKGFGKAR